MSFVIQRVTGRQISLSEIRTNVLRIGRGTNAELRSDNPAVALEHAVIESDSAGYSITDKGSITGTYVNGKPVETGRLAKGDVIEVGDLRIEVQVAEPNKPLFLRTVARVKPAAAAAAAAEDEEDQVVAAATPGTGAPVRAPKLDYADAFRLRRVWFTKLSLVALALIVTLIVVAEVTRPEKQSAFMPGGVTSAHARARDKNGASIAKDCDACHDPWNSVKDERCTACHQRVMHAENEKDPPTCMTCHTEHRGLPKLALINEATCASCHANLTQHVKVPLKNEAIRSITQFGKDHPELVSVDDPNNIRFNHKLHLKKGGVFNASGKREELKCDGCHKLVVTRGKADPVKLEFEAHCQRCHKLTFDARFPDAEIPHGGDPQLAYGYIATTYAGNRDIIGKSPAEVRRLLTRRAVVGLDERAVINAAQVLKTKCGKCHELKRTGERFIVDPPKIVTEWMPGSRFTHTAHSGLDCESCHRGLRDSVRTAEVHMPRRADCTACHGAGTTSASSCMTCHEYHVRSKPILAAGALPIAGGTSGTSGGEPRMIDTILLITITILVLVVLVPVGIALFQRMSRKPEAPAAAAAPRPAPPPLQKSPPAPAPPAAAPRAPEPPRAAPPAPAQRPPAAPPMPAAPPQAPPPAAPPAEATRIGNLSDMQVAAKSSGSTEFVEWYGMLLCMSGPLEGQRFVVEEEGLYIGRDAAMAQVVINDSRISKRHVRVVPRAGKVWAIDQGSTNGTFIGSNTTPRITEVQLKRGDTIVLADNAATFTYQI